MLNILGGGKDLATAASIVEARGNKVKPDPDIKPELDVKMGQMPMGSYHPKMGGMHPSPYDMMRSPQCKSEIWSLHIPNAHIMVKICYSIDYTKYWNYITSCLFEIVFYWVEKY